MEVDDLHTGVHMVRVFSNGMVDMSKFVDFDPRWSMSSGEPTPKARQLR